MLKKHTLRMVKAMWVMFASLVIIFAVAVSLVKFTLPYADDYKGNIEQYVLENFNAQISIGQIGASWQASGPAIVLYDLAITPTVNTPLDLAIKETQIEINFWQSLLQQRLVSGAFLLDGVDAKINSDVFYKVRPNSNGSQLFESLSHLFLSQLQSFKVVNSLVQVRHKQGKTQDYQIDALRWINNGNRHQASGELYVDGFSNNSVALIVDLYGQRRQSIFGQIYLEANKMDISPWLNQLISEHVSLESTEASFKVWGTVKDGLISDLITDVTDTGIRWEKDSQQQYLGVKSVRLQWEKSNVGWSVFSKDIQLNNGTEQYDGFQFLAVADTDKTHFSVTNGDILPVSRLFSLFSVTKQLGLLAKSQIDGELESFDFQLDKVNQISAIIKMNGLSLSPEKQHDSAYFGIQNVNLTGYWLAEQGWFELTGQQGKFDTHDTFNKDFAYSDVTVLTHVKYSELGTVINIPQITINNPDLSINLSGQYSNFSQPYLDLYGEVIGPKLGEIPNYLPKYLIPNQTHSYLMDALQQGRGELTQLAISGDPTQMPFSNVSGSSEFGTFVLKANLKQGQFSFDSSWPSINNMDAQLLMKDSLMTIKAQQGEFAGLAIEHDVEASLALDSERKTLQLLLTPEQLKLEEFHQLVATTPLNSVIGDIFEFVKLSGDSTATVNIGIPLYEADEQAGVSADVMVSGHVITDSAGLSLPELNLHFKQLNALVSFENASFKVIGNEAELFELPVSFEVQGNNKGEDYAIDAELLAEWEHAQIDEKYPLKLMSYFDGAQTTVVNVDVNIESEGFQYFVDANSDLTYTAYNVTTPIVKAMGTPSLLSFSMLGDQDGGLIQANLDDSVFFDANLSSESSRLDQARLSIGERVLQLPESGFDIAIEESYLEFEPTLTFVLDLIADLPESNGDNAGVIDAPSHIFGNIQNLSILEQNWQNVSLDAKPQQDAWLFSIGAKQALADITIFDDIESAGININASFLRLGSELTTVEPNPSLQEDKTKPTMKDSDELIRGLPPIAFSCARCFYNGKPLGEVTLKAHSLGPELIIDKANLSYNNNEVNLTGTWVGDSASGRTYLKGNIKSKEFGKWLDEYGFSTGIEESNASINLDLNWKSAPQWLDFDTLNGKADFRLGEGYFSEISDQGARLLSLFSFDSLYRKLKLDFKDIFSKGLFYNDVKGSIQLINGIGYSENIKMDGVAGDMSMVGYTNLRDNVLDYDVSFRPKITSSLPVLAWLSAVNPVTFLGVMALDKVIENADIVKEVRLKVTGDLKEPNVKEVKRFTQRVAIPVEEIEKQKEKVQKQEPKELPSSEQETEPEDVNPPVKQPPLNTDTTGKQ